MNKILFHHIPKTAGTSLIVHAKNLFEERAYDARYDDQLSDAAILDKRFIFYHGHFTRGHVLRFRHLVPDAKIFTFLRHPFSRLLSQYYNWIDPRRVRREFEVIAASSGETETLTALRTKFELNIFSMSLESFLCSEDPDILQATNNLQAQYMTLVEDLPNYERFHNAVINAISFYDFIGIQEIYGPCLRILEALCDLPCGSLGGDVRENVGHARRADGRYEVTAEQMRLLHNRSVYDLALYHACYALLLKQHGGRLPSEALDMAKLVLLPRVAC